MSEEAKSENAEMMGTKPVAEHAWLNNLVGEWKVTTEMVMGPDQPVQTSEGTESVTSFGGLWAYGEGKGSMPDGSVMEYKSAIGYDVSFKQYRGCWFATMSSHLWKYEGEMSEDGKKLTLNCVGPDMEKDGETANYRDVHELVDENTRTMTSFAETPDGWQQFMTATYTRA